MRVGLRLPRRRWLSGLAVLLIVTACTSHAPPRPSLPAGQQPTPTRDPWQERVVVEAILQLTHVAQLEQQYDRVVRQCLRDGHSETLCLRDPQAAYYPIVQRCLRDGHSEALCLRDPQTPYDP